VVVENIIIIILIIPTTAITIHINMMMMILIFSVYSEYADMDHISYRSIIQHASDLID
jgi:hypothetical protein